jgi:hypothetical protein
VEEEDEADVQACDIFFGKKEKLQYPELLPKVRLQG